MFEPRFRVIDALLAEPGSNERRREEGGIPSRCRRDLRERTGAENSPEFQHDRAIPGEHQNDAP
jgi:hypothetical protein